MHLQCTRKTWMNVRLYISIEFYKYLTVRERKTSGINLANTLLQSKWLLPWITFWLNPWKTLKTLNGLSINLNVCNFNGFSIEWGYFEHVLTSNLVAIHGGFVFPLFFHIIRCSCHHHSWGIKSKKKIYFTLTCFNYYNASSF